MRRWVTSLMAMIALMTLLTAGVRAGEENGAGGVLFRLELRGDVLPGDAFSLGVISSDGLIWSPGIRCGPGSELYTPEFVPCEAGVYEFGSTESNTQEIGTVLDYVWARIPAAGGDIVIHEGTVTMDENAQIITVVYDYGGGQALPDTAMTPMPDGAVNMASPIAVSCIAASLVAMTARRRSVPLSQD